MLNIVLYQPEIPPNTGNIIRLCANSGMQLHLIEPIAFDMDDKKLRRAGLDYHEFANILIHKNFTDFYTAEVKQQPGARLFSCTTKTQTSYSDISYQKNDYLLFGPETRGLPEDIRHDANLSTAITIPMKSNSRSINLSNAVAIIAFEAWRQLDFQ
ncbi:MAG: tRNA (uridine(34)/cytosine(34)/5-carboxymethylaminomethyluridine(34)-2'-O)-methyltransferase TrmL [Pseudomonadota bacterium]